MFDERTVVVVPFTVKSPSTVRLLLTVTFAGNPTVTEAVSVPLPVTSTSFVVPLIVAT